MEFQLRSINDNPVCFVVELSGCLATDGKLLIYCVFVCEYVAMCVCVCVCVCMFVCLHVCVKLPQMLKLVDHLT